MSNTTAGPATWRSLLAVREYRYLWLSYALSLGGDQLARVAIAVLIFTRTHSALLTGVVYAITFVPWLIGGPLLGGVADRYPRRTVMLACHLLSALLVAVLAVPGLPIPALCAVLFVVVLLESPFLSARAALLADVLPDDRYVLAVALNNVTFQLAQVLGFVAGGALVAIVGARPALLADAVTFLVSAALVRYAVRERPAARPATTADGATVTWRQQIRSAVRSVFGDPKLRPLVGLAWLAAFWVIPEGLAVPYASELHGSAVAVGLLLAAQPAGAGLGGLLLSRLVPPVRRLEIMTPLAVLCCLPLLAFAAHPGLPLAVGILALSGLGSCYNLPANAAFVQSVPAEQRGQAFGLVQSGLIAGQGLSIALAGALADHVGPAVVIAVGGALGTGAALLIRGVSRGPRTDTSELNAATSPT